MIKELQMEIETNIIAYSWNDIDKLTRAMVITLVYFTDWNKKEIKKYLTGLYNVGAIEELDISIDDFIKFMTTELENN